MNSLSFLVGTLLTILPNANESFDFTPPGGTVSADQPVADIFNGAASWLLAFVGGVAVIFVIIGGIQYASALGDSDKMDKAKRTLTWSLLGLILATLAYFIVPTVAKLFG